MIKVERLTFEVRVQTTVLVSSITENILWILIQGGHGHWKTGKTGKMMKKIPCMEKLGNLKKIRKSGKNQGFSNLILKT